MNEHQFKAIGLVAEAFEKHGIKFQIYRTSEQGELIASFPIKGGPTVMVKYIVRGDENDIAVRIFGLLSRIPAEKRIRLLEACNAVNREYRFLKFSMDMEGDINVDYDFLQNCADACVGEMAYEICARTINVLNEKYGILAKALYTDEELDL